MIKLPWHRHARSRGQSLVEFALILPILLLLVGGIIQYGVIFATKHSLTQVGRDVGRWAATQNVNPCHDAATGTPPQPVTEADALAQQSGLIGYSTGTWNSLNFVSYPTYLDGTALPPTPPSTEGVEAVWSIEPGASCPTVNSTKAAFVTIRLSHRAPVLLPGFPYLPGLGTCDASGCYLAITTTSEYRMEPPPP